MAFEQIGPAMAAINVARRKLDEGATREEIHDSLNQAAKHIRLIRYYWDWDDKNPKPPPPEYI